MDPCSFVRIIVGNLAVRFPASSSSEPSVSAPNCYCKIRFKNFPRQIISVPVIFQTESESESRSSSTVAACFSLSKAQIDASLKKTKFSVLSVETYLRGDVVSGASCGLAPARRNKAESDPELHPECSPQVFQVQGNTKQAVFTCKFAARSCISSEKEQQSKERKGWSITVHGLSGSPIAMASMLTPFVPSPGSNRVTKSSPGAWLILRPDGCTWKPWGRLEAWREAGYSEKLGYSFELLQDGVATAVSASSSISLKNGGSFVIDVTGGTTTAVSTPTTSPYGSCDLGSRSSSGSRSGSGSDFGYLLPQHPAQNRGFVMSASVEGVGKRSKPDLDACKLFSHKLRKELRQQSQLGVV
ncbi:hypothetical protein HID58_054076 [Brassica napus]|uniref:Uncharacterized protein n=1 Tax=Brassica napus TaxID=3708 RepID=A0ABQ8AGH4_BRANA|nr:hypothetical protein HID58_054076 [Brassica napus]